MQRFGALLILVALTVSHSAAQAPAVQSEPEFSVLVPLLGTSNAVTIMLPAEVSQIFMAVMKDGEVVLEADRSVDAQDVSVGIATLTAAAFGHVNGCDLRTLLSLSIKTIEERPLGQQTMHRCLEGQVSIVRRTQRFPSLFWAPMPREADLNTWHLLEAADTTDQPQQSGTGTDGTLFFYFYLSDGSTMPPPVPGLLDDLPGQQL